MSGKVATQLHEKEPYGSALVVSRWRRHGVVQHVGVEMKERLVHGLACVFDFDEHLLLWNGRSGEFLVPVPNVPVLPEQMADKMSEVAAEVNRQGADGVRDAIRCAPQYMIGSCKHLLCQGLEVSCKDLPQ